MPGFVAVRCCQCRLPQVQQAKKSAKWTCRVCNQTQSLMRVLFESHSAAECRAAVQQISMQAAERDQAAAVLIHTAVSAAAAQAAEASEASVGGDTDIQPPLPPGHRAPIFSKARSLQQPASHAQPAPRHPRTDWSLFVEPEEQDDSRAGGADAHRSDDPSEIEQHVSWVIPDASSSRRATGRQPAKRAMRHSNAHATQPRQPKRHAGQEHQDGRVYPDAPALHRETLAARHSPEWATPAETRRAHQQRLQPKTQAINSTTAAAAAAAASKWGAFVEQDDDDGYH